jgi:hypothetical protein
MARLVYHTISLAERYKTFYILPTDGVYVFYTDLITDSDYLLIQHTLISFYTPPKWKVFTARYDPSI